MIREEVRSVLGFDLMRPVRATVVRLAALILFTAGLFGCDYATKSAAKATLEGTEGLLVAPDVFRGTLELRYVENYDIAFSVLRRLGVPRSPELLIAISAVALALIVAATLIVRRSAARAKAAGPADAKPARALEPADVATRAGIALVLSGALGNIVDRVVRGYVVDFIHVKGWPVFNVADIAVVVGACMIALAGIYRHGATADESDDAADPHGRRLRRRNARSASSFPTT